MVHGHQVHRLAAQQTDAVQLTAVAQHEGKPQVIRRRRDQPAAARQEAAAAKFATFRCVGEAQPPVPLPFVIAGKTLKLLVGHGEGRVGHAQRRENVLAQVGIEPLTGDHLDQIARHVRGDRVIPARAGGELQRQLRQGVHHVLEGVVGPAPVGDAQAAVSGVDVGALHEAVGEAGGVAEQVADGHGPLRRRREKGRVIAADEHPQPLPGRNEAVHGIVELAQALFNQHHQRHGGDGLAHRIDAKDAVALHGSPAFDLEVPLRLEKGDVAVAGHQGQGAGELAVVDVALEMTADAVEAGG